MSYQFITIEGNIGVGKTTFSKMLAKELSYRIVLEEFADNPFLPKFYNQPERYAFSLELFFMAERYRQMGDLREQDLFSKGVVTDYFFVKSKLFAENNLSDDELLLFNRLSDIALNNLPKPDLIIGFLFNIFQTPDADAIIFFFTFRLQIRKTNVLVIF